VSGLSGMVLKTGNEMFLMVRTKPWKQALKRKEKDPDKKDRWREFPSRCTENVISASALVHDLDNKEKNGLPVIDPEWLMADFFRCQAMFATSASSKPGYPCGRIVIPITREVTAKDYKLIQSVILNRLDYSHPHYVGKGDRTALDPQSRVISQPNYLPQHSANPFILECDGALFDVDRYLAGISRNERVAILGGTDEPKREGKPIADTDENLMQCVACLQAFDPDEEGDRWRSASALYKVFGDKAEPYWQEWYSKATRWDDSKAAKKMEGRGYVQSHPCRLSIQPTEDDASDSHKQADN
jgi:hypothetical protein